MGDWADITKRLTISRARQATLAEAQNHPVPFDKYYGLNKSRDIKLIPTYFRLPAFSYPTGTFNPQDDLVPRLAFQYNVTLPGNFYLLNPTNTGPLVNGALFVKWRVGTEVFRYFISGLLTTILGVRKVFAPQYNNNLIKANCCFEFWFVDQQQFTTEIGMTEDTNFFISMLNVPSTGEDLLTQYEAGAPIEYLDLGNDLPENLPVTQPNIAWLDNV